MRFRFFSLRRKSTEFLREKPKKTSGCCLQTHSDDNSIDLHNLGSDVTTILHGSISSSSYRSTQRSSCDLTPSLGEQASHFISVKTGCPDDQVQKNSASPIRSYQQSLEGNGRTETDESDATSPRCEQENIMRRWRRMRPSLSSPKGPGLGSIFDNPPTRMLQERNGPDFSEYARSQQRRQTCGIQAPELPTRLEICSEGDRRRSLTCRIDEQGAQRRSRDESGLNSGRSDSGSQEESSPLRRHSFPSSRGKHSSASLGSDDSTPSSRRRSPRTQSPGQLSRRSSESIQREEDALQQQQQQHPKHSIETMRRLSQCGAVARCEIEMKPANVDMKKYKSAYLQGNPAACLHEWRIGIKLKWISEREDDLVTEVHMTDISQEYEKNTEVGADARRKSKDSHLVETNRRERQLSLVARVDRILTELQRQKRSRTKNKQRTKVVAAAVDSKGKIGNRAHGQSQSRRQGTAVGTESYRENSGGPVQRTRRRKDMLQAFEVLISRMEEKLAALDGSFLEDEILSQRSLTEAVLSELRREVSRLERELADVESFGTESEVAMTTALWMPSEPTPSRISDSYLAEKEGSVNEDQVHGWQRSQSHQTASSRLLRAMNGPIPEQRSLLTYPENLLSPRSHLDSSVHDRRTGLDERPSNIALYDEDSIFMQGADLKNRMTASAALW